MNGPLPAIPMVIYFDAPTGRMSDRIVRLFWEFVKWYADDQFEVPVALLCSDEGRFGAYLR